MLGTLCGMHTLTTLSLCLHSVQAYFWKFNPERGECAVRAQLMEGGMASVWSIWSWVTELSVFGAVPLSILALNTRVISETRKISARDLQFSSRLPNCSLLTYLLTYYIVSDKRYSIRLYIYSFNLPLQEYIIEFRPM